MIQIPTLSFCITCKNRFYQISQTLRKNLDDNRLHNEWIEFVLVDFGSTDGLQNWIITNFIADLDSGYLKYYYTDELPYWHASIAKNTSHFCSNHQIVLNLDCDNFVGYLGGLFVIRKFLSDNNIVLHQFSGNLPDGSFGRIAVFKTYFELIGGYDESLNPMGYQDLDLINRLIKAGIKYSSAPNKEYCLAIPNTKLDGIRFAKSTLNYSQMEQSNCILSNKYIREGKLISNNGNYGIRKNLYDHTGRLLLKSKFNFESKHTLFKSSTLNFNVLKNNRYSEINILLLKKIAIYAGFATNIDLFNGKMGVAILLYHASRIYCLKEMELIADTLINDIIKENKQQLLFKFKIGSSDIAWGLSYLKANNFIDIGSDFFEDIDSLLFNPETEVNRKQNPEYPFLGLYILSRYENSSKKNGWITKAKIYCNNLFELINKDISCQNTTLLLPFWYSLLMMKKYKFPFMEQNDILKGIYESYLIVGNEKQMSITTAFAKLILNKILQKNEECHLPEINTICDINALYFHKLLYSELEFPSKEMIDETLFRIVINKQLIDELLILLNHQNIGISGYVSGLAWSLLHQ